MKLLEVLQTTVPYYWVEQFPTYYAAEFLIKDKKYKVSFMHWEDYEDMPNSWDIEFALDGGADFDRFDLTGTGNSLLVFGTISAIAKEWASKVKPTCITMSADVPSRKSLYTRLIANQLPNWKSKVVGNKIIAAAPQINLDNVTL